ncbi:MAG: IclR family transcriptional regulator [Chloroflexi bacterium]|nr:IclR family transcriptional regulator [Anaerolineaceae bacterium]NMB86948.1 IclR family transcriptional regulator [Chloroflexota bacterium]
MKDTNSVQSIERAFQILDLLRDQRREMGVNDIAAHLDLSVTTVHRLLQTLVGVKAVRQNGITKHYGLAPSMLLFGKAVLDQFDFIRSAHPFLGELSKAVGETAFMGILDDFELVYVDHVDSLDHSLRMTPQIGRRQGAHCTSLGKVLLAHLDYQEREAFLARQTFPKLTENTLTTADALRVELDKIRAAGYGFDLEEAENGICCVAAPVIGLEGEVIAAISISGPASRVRNKGIDTLLCDHVVSTAQMIHQHFLT